MVFKIHHSTRFLYEESSSDSHNELRLMPQSDDEQVCLKFSLMIKPAPKVFSYTTTGGLVHYFNILNEHDELHIATEAVVETRRLNPFVFLNLVEDDWWFYEKEETRQDYAEYLTPTRLVPLHPIAEEVAGDVRRNSGMSVASFLIALTRELNNILIYEPGHTHVHTTLDEMLRDYKGVCQDFAHMMLAVCRSQGIPARYVSGYVFTQSDQTMRAEQATHAWVECLMPGGIWRGFDPTNNLLVNEYYVKVFTGRDYSDAAPTKGIYRGGGSSPVPRVSVDVEMLYR